MNLATRLALVLYGAAALCLLALDMQRDGAQFAVSLLFGLGLCASLRGVLIAREKRQQSAPPRDGSRRFTRR